MSVLENIGSTEILNLFTYPVKWCEAFLKDPNDKDKPFQLRSYQREILEKSRTHRRIILRYGRRMGKCQGINDLCVLSTGQRITFGELYDRITSGEKLSVISINDKYQFVESLPILINKNGIKKLYRLKTKSGKKIDATENHPFLTVKGWKWLNELKEGDSIVVPSSIPVNTNKKIDEFKIKLLAYLISDGSIIHAIQFTNGIEKVQNEFKQIVKDFDCDIRNGRITSAYKEYYVSGKKISDKIYATNYVLDYLKKLGLHGKNSFTKYIPNEILTLSTGQLKIFLSRLYACDGWASVSKSNRKSGNCEIGYCSVSEELAYGVSHLLTRFGIRHFITEKEIKYKGTLKKAFQICIRTKSDILKFIDEIGIFGKEKECQLVKDSVNVREDKETYFDSFPTKETIDFFDIKRPRANNIRRQYKRTSKFKFIDYANKVKNADLLALCNAAIYFDEISSIDYIGEQETFDLEVPEYHNYISNDILVHNSITMCADTLWWCSAYPIVRMIEEGRTRQLPYTVIIATPYETQIKELWSVYTSLIADSPLLKEQIVKIRTSDVHTIEFDNGSIIKGYTIGISSSNRGTSLRSLSADMVFLDEMDFIPREIIEQVIMPIWTTHQECRLRICSTPSGERSLFYEWCFPNSTKINTLDGLRNIEEIKIGDVVYGEDGYGENVKTVYKQPYIGLTKRIFTALGDFSCTPNHELKILNKDFIRSDKAEVGDYICVPIEQHIPLYNISIDVSKYLTDREKQRINKLTTNSKYKTKEKKFGDLWSFDNRKRTNLIKAQEFLKNPLSEDMYKLLGFYLAEGNVLKDMSKKKYSIYSGIQLTFNESETEYIEECSNLMFSIFGKRPKIVNGRDDHSVSILLYSSWISYVFIELCGEYSDKKQINPNILGSSHDQHLLINYIKGDGTGSFDTQFSFASTSEQLTNQMLQISYRFGKPVGKYFKRGSLGHKDSYQCNTISRFVKFIDNSYWVRISKIKDEEYNGYVYNLETHRTHTYNVNNMTVHNCTKAEELGWLHRHYASWHPDNTNWMSIEQAKAKGVPVTESTEYQVRAITSASNYDREYGAEFGEEFGGVYKSHMIAKSLRKYGRNIDVTNPEIFNPGFQQNFNNLYIIGVDWNSYINGGQIVLLEFCRERTVETFFDDELGTDVTIDFTGKYRLFYRRGITSKDATQRNTREEIIRLLRIYKIDFVYVDYGAGDTNIEELTLYGREHLELQLNRKLKVVDSGASVEHWDPVLGKLVKKRNKSLMVNFSALNLEEGMYILPKEEDEQVRLIGQMRGYKIKNVTNRGDYTYEGDDHILDAFNLAVYGFQKEYGSILSNKITYKIIFMNDPRFRDYPTRAYEVSDSPVAPARQSRAISDPEKIIQRPRMPVRLKMPTARPNINFRGRSTF